MILVFPSAVVREPWKEAVSAPWEMSEWTGTEEFLPFSPPKFPLSGVWLQSVAPFWLTVPWIFEYLLPPDPPSPFLTRNWKQEMLYRCCECYWETWLGRLLQYCCKFCLGMSLGVLMEALNKDFPGAEFCHPVSVLSRECIIHHGYGRCGWQCNSLQ